MDAFLPNFKTAEPVQDTTPTIADVKPNEPAPLAKPLTNLQGESISPELLTELRSYIEQTVVATVAQAVTTVVPDVVEATLARVSQPASVPQSTSPVRQANAQPDDYADYVPGQGIGQRSSESKSDLIAWLATGGIVAVMAGLAAYTINAAPNAQTTQVMGQQGAQIEAQNGLIQDLAKEAAQAKCRAFCF